VCVLSLSSYLHAGLNRRHESRTLFLWYFTESFLPNNAAAKSITNNSTMSNWRHLKMFITRLNKLGDPHFADKAWWLHISGTRFDGWLFAYRPFEPKIRVKVENLLASSWMQLWIWANIREFMEKGREGMVKRNLRIGCSYGALKRIKRSSDRS
jgi:hypothetical protein